MYLKGKRKGKQNKSSFDFLKIFSIPSTVHMSTFPFHTKSCSPEHVAYRSPNHAPILPQLFNPDSDASSQVIQVRWWHDIHLRLEVPPQEKIQRCQIRGSWGPLDSLSQSNNEITKKLCETICQCSRSVTRSVVLCPLQVLKSAISPFKPYYLLTSNTIYP